MKEEKGLLHCGDVNQTVVKMEEVQGFAMKDAESLRNGDEKAAWLFVRQIPHCIGLRFETIDELQGFHEKMVAAMKRRIA